MAKRTITLGDRSFAFTVPLTLGQLMEANVGIALPPGATPEEESRRSWRRAIDVIVAAVQPEHPDVNADMLLEMRGVSLADFNAAARAALEESGLVAKPDGGETAGEGQATEGEAPAGAE